MTIFSARSYEQSVPALCSSRLDTINCWRNAGHLGDHQGNAWSENGNVLTITTWNEDGYEGVVVTTGSVRATSSRE